MIRVPVSHNRGRWPRGPTFRSIYASKDLVHPDGVLAEFALHFLETYCQQVTNGGSIIFLSESFAKLTTEEADLLERHRLQIVRDCCIAENALTIGFLVRGGELCQKFVSCYTSRSAIPKRSINITSNLAHQFGGDGQRDVVPRRRGVIFIKTQSLETHCRAV